VSADVTSESEGGRAEREAADQPGRDVADRPEQVERDAPDQPSDLPRGAWSGVLRRPIKEFNADLLSDLAAALTYYGILAIFPMLVVIVSLVGLLGHSVSQSLIHNLSTVAPGTTKQILTNAIENIQRDRSASGVAFVIGLVAAMWSASARRDGRSTRRCRSGWSSR
jgi:membrane protein